MQRSMNTMNLLAILAVIMFIWGNSLLTSAQSSALSTEVASYIKSILSTLNLTITLNGFEPLVRKLAHAFEFSVLGLFIMIYGWKRKNRGTQFWVTLGIGLFIALVDEFYQLFVAGRGSSFVDVGIDFIGFSTIVFLLHILHFVMVRPTKSANKKAY